jgi:hypothetical protein
MATVTYTFDSYEDADELRMHQRVSDMQSAIYETSKLIRSELKHGEWENEKVYELLERLSETLWVEGLLE